MPASEEQLEPAAGSGAVLKTLLICDLVGSTRLVEELGDVAAAELLHHHDRLARDLLAEHGGREIDKTDGFLLLFARPFDAVRFGLDYHAALRRLSEGRHRVIEARLGIHLGEVVLRENPAEDVARGAKPLEVEGLAKPLAARLMSLASGGQTLLTRAAFDVARRSAVGADGAGELRWLAHGCYRLAGVAEPVEVFEVGREGAAPLVPPPDGEKGRRVEEPTQLIGWRPAPGVAIPHRSHWRVEERLGEGGFGEVWLAAHEKTGDRRVFKFCYDAERLRTLQREITLFRLLKEELGEREDIARILDWSFEEPPYFIESEASSAGSLPDWLEREGGVGAVPLTTRLEIVAQVATALAAAHSVGVLHKDVKPSNVLIRNTSEGGVQAQLADFGVGHVIDRERLSDAGITVLGLTERIEEETGSALSGTRLYMAPELLEGGSPTLQTDIYALGVLLYQLVVGDFRRALAPGWRRDVTDELLVEDIACFVDRSLPRRPASAREIAERLRNLAARRAERAAAEAARRAFERSQRRRKLSAMIAAVAVGVLVVVSLFALWAVEARREEERARRGAERVTEFLIALFESGDPYGRSDPGVARGETVTAREILDRGAAALQDELGADPLIRARLIDTVGSIYFTLGLYDSAEPLLRQALALRRDLLGDDDLAVADSLDSLAVVLQFKGELAEAEALLRESVAISRRLQPDYDGGTLGSLASVLHDQGKYEEAEVLYRESLTLLRRTLGVGHLDTTTTQENLAALLHDMGELDEAEALYRESLARNRAALGDEHPDVALTLGNLGLLLKDKGDYEAAEPLLRESLALMRRLLGDEHLDVAVELSNLASLRLARGDVDEAQTLVREALGIFARTLAPDHWRIARAESILGACFTQLRRYEEAEPLLLRSYEILRETLSENSYYTRIARDRLVTLYQAWGKPAKVAEDRAR